MEVKKIKTVRFSQLVKESGKPKQVILWTAPEKDREFSKAIREKRVMTIFQRNVGTQKDFGLVGFFKEKSAAFLVFPKAPDYPAETKVVGIKYDAIAQSEPSGGVFKSSGPRNPGIPLREKSRRQAGEKPKKEVKKPEKPERPREPKRWEFEAMVEMTAKQCVPISVEAKSVKEADALLRKKAEEVQMDAARAKIIRKVSRAVKRKK